MRNIIDHQGYQSVCEEAGLAISVADALIEARLARLSASGAPFILHMLGIPGAGKSTYIRGRTFADAFLLSFDAVMEELPGYQADRVAHGNAAAFARWELCAREIGYELLFRAAERGLDIVFDHGGARPDHAEMLRHLKEKRGYRVKVVWLDIDGDLARERTRTRDRHLPPEYIEDRRAAIARLLPVYRALADEFVTG